MLYLPLPLGGQWPLEYCCGQIVGERDHGDDQRVNMKMRMVQSVGYIFFFFFF